MNMHDFAGYQKLAGAMHESGHAVIGIVRGAKLKRITRDETIFEGPHDPVVIHAGALAVRTFDPKGRHSADDDGDRANLAKLNISPIDAELARATAAELVARHWQSICDVACELDRSPSGDLTPQRVEELTRGKS